MSETRKEYFFSKFEKPCIFDCMEFNLLKVAQSGIKRNLNQGIVKRNLIDIPIYIVKLVYIFKWIKSRFVPEKNISSSCTTLFTQANRFIPDGPNSRISVYSNRISEYFDLEKIVFLTNGFPDMSLNYSPPMISIAEFSDNDKLPISRSEAILLDKLKKTYSKICQLSSFSKNELISIKIALHEFFISYRMWHRFLRKGQVRRCYFICPYTSEAIVLAMKRNNIEVVELQHGIIGVGSDFYIYPASIISIRDRMLFADRVWVFGRYWKNVLLLGFEYDKTQIDIIGDYYYREVAEKKEIENDEIKLFKQKKVILIITQSVTKPKYFIEYALFLQKYLKDNGKSDFIVVIKPHPNEKMENYLGIASDRIKISSIDTTTLLKEAYWIVSIYSTVLFEALRYGKRCFSLLVSEYDIFVQQLVKSGAFEGLEMKAFPQDKKKENDFSVNFYAEFNIQLLEN